jgi:hypothetical protein
MSGKKHLPPRFKHLPIRMAVWSTSFLLAVTLLAGGALLLHAPSSSAAVPESALISIFPAWAFEEPCGSSALVFDVIAQGQWEGTVSVYYQTSPGDNNPATPGFDYQHVEGTLNFPQGINLRQVVVPVFCDGVNEPTEEVKVTLSNLQGDGSFFNNVAIGLIYDSDTPELTINDISVPEGDDGASEALLHVSLSIPAYQEIEFDYETLAGTATPGEDYVPTTGTLVIPLGETSVPVTVEIIGDLVDEGDETFSVRVTVDPNPGVIIAKNEGVVTILDDDQAGLSWEPPGTLVTSEWGDSVTFNVMLTSQPVASVVVAVTSTDPSEGLPNLSQLQFTTENWNVAQAVRVTGVDDFVCDGDQTYTLMLDPAPSSDATYQALSPFEVPAVNLDDETECLYLPLTGMRFNPPLYVFESFNSPQAVENWEVIATEGQGAVVLDGKFILDQRTRNYNVKGIAPIGGIYRDYAVEVTAQRLAIADESTRYGIIFDWLDNDRFYRFIIEEENGLYAIQKWQNGWIFLTNGWEPSAILQTQPGPYRLRVERRGPEIRVFINGQRPNLTPVFDTTYRYGGAGVIMIAQPDLPDGDLAAASFDDFLVIGLDD